MDICNALNAGKIATAHEARINFHGWIGEGYILMDPRTGAGAYMISGGRNGGDINTSFSDALTWITLALGLADSFKSILLKVSGPIGLVMGYTNLISSIISFGNMCKNVAASALMAIAVTAMYLLGALLSLATFGLAGILVSVGISIAMHTAGLYLNTVLAEGC